MSKIINGNHDIPKHPDPTTLSDADLITYLINYDNKLNDANSITKKILDNFENIFSFIHADKDKVFGAIGKEEKIYYNCQLLKEIIRRSLQNKIKNKNVIKSYGALIKYLKFTMGTLVNEELHILFLNKRNILIADELIFKGTVDHLHFYPRDIIKKILFHNATSIILVHNHPSGSTTPSQADIHYTNAMMKLCECIHVKIYDHIIVAGNEYFSFKKKIKEFKTI